MRSNQRLYDAAGVARFYDRLTREGVLAVWAANASPAFERRLLEARGPLWRSLRNHLLGC